MDDLEEPVSPEMSSQDEALLIYGPVTPWIPNQTELENELAVRITYCWILKKKNIYKTSSPDITSFQGAPIYIFKYILSEDRYSTELIPSAETGVPKWYICNGAEI